MEAEPAFNEPKKAESKPLFIATELPNGIRFVAHPTDQAAPGTVPPFLLAWLFGLAILLTPFVFASIYLERIWEVASRTMVLVSLFYLLQLLWDAYVVSAIYWWLMALARGKYVIRLAGNRLKAGHKWGPFWCSPSNVSLSDLTRLVIVRQPLDETNDSASFRWTLLAQHRAGMPVVLVSEVDEADNVRDVSQALHSRLAASSHLSVSLPPLQEELWTWNAQLSAAPKPLSTGRFSLLIHLAGTGGLICLIQSVADHPPLPDLFRGIAMAMSLMQGLFLLLCIYYVRLRQQQRTSGEA